MEYHSLNIFDTPIYETILVLKLFWSIIVIISINKQTKENSTGEC